MTALVGLVAPDGSVIVMADSAASNESGVWVQRDRKVWTRGEMAMGICGSFRGRDLLESNLKLPPVGPEEDAELFVRTVFVEQVRDIFGQGGFAAHFNDGQEKARTGIVIGFRGRVFMMRNDYSIAEPYDDFVSVGSGSSEVQSALFVTRDQPDDPMRRLSLAMEAAAYFNAGSVRPPFHYARTAPWRR